ncbi:hypothetical protein Poli38472_007355 [Pythium oligandrum]|uniref:Folate-Biopterin Transporter (FBT) Family n=1 Tax=Pythium oligandrum TaxID=41045 RepID=A0A8K1CAD9_PYTOL|nr:hypothetical protein Poli38472_007355 [Pythium oligandrum]|eukprot:TMW59210.1 hypothetical protein Poli38472_007355 [Pythium oligandrum]
MPRTPVSAVEVATRASYVSHTSVAKDGDYLDMKTPDVIEGGAIRAGGAPKLFSKQHIGLVAQYAAVGLVDSVLPATIYPFLQNYLNVNGATAVTASTLVQLPWSFKVFYGIVSDCVPIFGFRRRPYMVLGWTIAIIMLLAMGFMKVGSPYWADPNDAYIDPDEDPAAWELALSRANEGAPGSGNKYVAFMMLTAFGYLMSDVCADGVVVELAQREPLEVRGWTQTVIYTTRTAFNIVGSAITGFAFNGEEYGGSFGFSLSFPTLMLIIGFVMMPIIPITWFFIAEEKHEPKAFKPYLAELWRLVQTRAVYQVIFYNFFSGIFFGISSTAYSPMQRYMVHVEPINSTISGIIGSFIYMIGIWMTGKYGLDWNWRTMTVITGFFVLLIDGITSFITIWDIFRSQWFWLGLPLAYNLPYGVNFLIGTFVTVELAGEGNEGAMYGLLTTVANLANPFSATLTKIIDRNWDLSNARIQEDSHGVRMDISYTLIIMYVTNVISWLFLYWLPPQKAETQELIRTGGSNKWLGGLTLLYIAFAFVWSVMVNLMGIFDSTSCLIIAGGNGC